MSALQHLENLRALLDDPDSWIQNNLARTASGRWIDPEHGMASCWCLTGGLMRVTGPDLDGFQGAAVALREAIPLRERIPIERMKGIGKHMTSTSLVHWNDFITRSHPEVVALIDRAIASEKERAA